MAGKVVNLRTVRKQRDRAADRAAAGVSAARHGEAMTETDRRRAEAERAARALDGHRRDPSTGDA